VTKIKEVQFINVVSFGGQIKSCNGKVVGDRPGQEAAEIELDEKQRFFKMSKVMNGKLRSKYVPMSNVSGFEIIEEEVVVKPAVKK
jgi:hypothetical protein